MGRWLKGLLTFLGASHLLAVTLGASTLKAQSVTASISFVSDPSWQVFAMNSDGGRGEYLGMAQCVCQVPGWPCYWGANLSNTPGACWVWRPDATPSSPADLQGAYFSKDFDISDQPVSGDIWVAVDDFAEVSVNAFVVGATGSITDYNSAAAAQGALRHFSFTPFLISGKNTITVRAQNGPAWFAGGRCGPCNYGGNEAGLVFGGSITSTPGMAVGSCGAEVVKLQPGAADFGFGFFDTLQCSAVPEPLDEHCMVGAPDLRMCSIGERGSVTIRMDPPVSDGSGDDLVVWGSCNAANEPADVFISEDGVTFVHLGTFDHGVTASFDLGGTGLQTATLVRIDDLPGGTGIDVDAVCALNVLMPVSTVRETWGKLKLKYR